MNKFGPKERILENLATVKEAISKLEKIENKSIERKSLIKKFKKTQSVLKKSLK